jgi:D-alanine transfer protein
LLPPPRFSCNLSPLGDHFPVLPRPHLQAAAAALGLLGLILVGGVVGGLRLEHRYLRLITPELGRSKDLTAAHSEGIQRLEHVKNQGLALQRLAFRESDLLPLYGSSELMKPIPEKASLFFRQYPTGFDVFPVGKAGATSIILLQKIAAANPARNAKVALSISPGWFIRPGDGHYYDGNFSSQQALALVFHPRLSFSLKRDLARRMLEFPETLERRPLLHFTAKHLASGTSEDRTLYYLAQPLGVAVKGVNCAQDHLETSLYILSHRRHWGAEPQRQPASLEWDRLLATAAANEAPPPHYKFRRKFDTESAFTHTLQAAPEWRDFELLLRTCKELHLRPLVLSMPPPTNFLEQQGISDAAIGTYLTRLEALGRRYHVPVEAFRDHFADAGFLADNHDHLSGKGWMYYNRALDDFFHSTAKRRPLSRHRNHGGA